MGTTLAALKEVIQSSLGAGARSVELTDGHLNRGITQALRLLGRHLPEKGFTVLPVTTTVQKYLLDKANIVGVQEVVFFNNAQRLIMYPYPDSSVDQYLLMGQLKEQQKTWGDMPEWEWLFDTDATDGDKEKCYILTHFTLDSFRDRLGRIPTHMAVTYNWHLSASDDKKVGLPRLKHDNVDWVERYATEVCRQILGDVRGKFGGIPGPNDGELLVNDGRDLVTRATQEIRLLEEDLRGRMRQLPPVFD